MGQQAIPDDAGFHSAIDEGYESLAKTGEDGTLRLSVLVSGTYCAACIYKIESAVKTEPGVSHARLNFSTGQLNIEWQGKPAAANLFTRKIESLGYGVRPYDIAQENEQLESEEKFLLLCLGVAGFAMGNIMLVSIGLWSTTTETMGMVTRDFMHWISALIAIPTILFSGRPFFRSAFAALKAGHTNMDVPISVGLTLAGSMSLFETINHGEHAYFDSAVMLIFFLLIGRYFDFRARKKARSSASDLLSSLSGFAAILEDGKPRHVLIRELKEGQIVRVAAGEKFPVDGLVTEGASDADLSLVTGETVPVAIGPRAAVYAGTLNLSAPVTMTVMKEADNSLLADIVRLMDKAGQGQARYVRLADKMARLYTPVVHLLALITFLVWWGVVGIIWQKALMIAITVLIITCPCALGLAVPVVQVLATNRLMRHGILVKSGDAFERLATIDTILMDKTGTLTLGKPRLAGQGDPDHLRIAASLAAHSSHPLSLALVQACNDPLLPVTGVREHPGQGMEGIIEGRTLRLGSRRWCGDQNRPEHADYLELWLDIEGQPAIPFLFADRLRTDSADTIKAFHADGLYPVLLSGDRAPIVQKIAAECSIDRYLAEQSPPEKYTYLENLKEQGHKILMVGDGLNDAPSLSAADVSIAPGTAIGIAQNAADIIFMGEKMAPVYQAYDTARLTQKLVKQNFILAALYNAIAIPVAALGFLTPLLAALAMSGSSLIVIINSFRVRSDA